MQASEGVLQRGERLTTVTAVSDAGVSTTHRIQELDPRGQQRSQAWALAVPVAAPGGASSSASSGVVCVVCQQLVLVTARGTEALVASRHQANCTRCTEVAAAVSRYVRSIKEPHKQKAPPAPEKPMNEAMRDLHEHQKRLADGRSSATDNLVFWMARKGIPFNAVDDPQFKRFVAQLLGKPVQSIDVQQNTSRKRVAAHASKLAACVQSMAEEMCRNRPVVFATDAWDGVGGAKVFSVDAHFLDDAYKPVHFNASTFVLPTGINATGSVDAGVIRDAYEKEVTTTLAPLWPRVVAIVGDGQRTSIAGLEMLDGFGRLATCALPVAEEASGGSSNDATEVQSVDDADEDEVGNDDVAASSVHDGGSSRVFHRCSSHLFHLTVRFAMDGKKTATTNELLLARLLGWCDFSLTDKGNVPKDRKNAAAVAEARRVVGGVLSETGEVGVVVSCIQKIGALWKSVQASFRSSYQHFLDKRPGAKPARSLKLHSQTRWGSTLEMFRVFLEHLEHYVAFAAEGDNAVRHGLPRLPATCSVVLEQLVCVLNVIDKFVQPLSGEQYVTLHLVVRAWSSCVGALRAMSKSGSLSPGVALHPDVHRVVKRGLFYLLKPQHARECLTSWCLLAAVLDPAQCGLQDLPVDVIFLPARPAHSLRGPQRPVPPWSTMDCVGAVVKACVAELCDGFGLRSSVGVAGGDEMCGWFRPDKPADKATQHPAADQLDEYMTYALAWLKARRREDEARAASATPTACRQPGKRAAVAAEPAPLDLGYAQEFWAHVGGAGICAFPIIERLARLLFSIPASSASSERTFSAMNRLWTDSRASLSSESLRNLTRLCRGADAFVTTSADAALAASASKP